jgi:hypothetical protein
LVLIIHDARTIWRPPRIVYPALARVVERATTENVDVIPVKFRAKIDTAVTVLVEKVWLEELSVSVVASRRDNTNGDHIDEGWDVSSILAMNICLPGPRVSMIANHSPSGDQDNGS